MYIVLQKCTEENSVIYAVTNAAEDSEVEFVSSDDLKLLAIVGLQMQTPKGEPVKVENGELQCDVEEFDPNPEPPVSDEDDDIYSLYGEEEVEEGSEEAQNEDEDLGYEDLDVGEDGEDSDGSDEDDFDPYDGFDIGDDYETAEESVVSKLYAMMNQDQITVLRRYYLWYSQRLFTDAQKGGMQGFKNKAAAIRKRNTLNQLKGNGDYRYAGFLDTGSKYAGYTCSLGHPLRFMHLAWDITVGDIDTAFFGQDYNADYEAVINSNNCIAFGIQCIGDFFEVDQECIRSLQRAQRDSLKDMALMYQILTTENVDAVKHSFDLLDEVLKITDRYDMKLKMMKNAEPTIPFSVASFYHQFRAAGMIPPKSLVQEIRSCLVGWTDGRRYFSNSWTGYLRAPDRSFYQRLKVIAKKANDIVVDKLDKRNYVLEKSSYLVGFNLFVVYIYLFFTYEICGYYKYTATKDGFHDEGGYNKSSVGWQFPTYYKKSIHNQFVGSGFNMETLRGLFELTRLCLEAEKKYNAEGTEDAYKLPYFSMGKIYYEDLRSQGRYTTSNRMNEILKGYVQIAGSDDIYKLINFMTGAIFVGVDTVTTMSSASLLSHYADFKPCIIDRRKLDLQLTCSVLKATLDKFDAEFTKLHDYAQSIADADEQAYKKKQEEEERLKEEARKAQEAAEAASPVEIPTTRAGVVAYLQSVGVDGVTDKKMDFAKKVLDTLVKSGKEPTDRQFQYLQPLYEAVAGAPYGGDGKAAEKVELSSRQDIQEAITWVRSHEVQAGVIAQTQGVDDFQKLLNILGSIEKYGKISERQMRYAEMALAIHEESKK